LEPILYPLFVIEPVAWELPRDGGFDAVLMTSANAARHAGAGLTAMCALPCYCVGEATAQAAREMGFADVRVGGGDAASTIPLLVADGRSRVLHPCGVDLRPFDPRGLRVEPIPVYRSAERGDAAILEALIHARAPAVAMVHSPRAGARLDALLSMASRTPIAVVAISEAAAEACGGGWREMLVATSRNDIEMITCVQRVASPAD
jgi:uroporphyrinogen-III synthase